jgi:hypothetical protein
MKGEEKGCRNRKRGHEEKVCGEVMRDTRFGGRQETISPLLKVLIYVTFKIPSLPQREHSDCISVRKTNLLMLFRKVTTIIRKPISIPCGQKVIF